MSPFMDAKECAPYLKISLSTLRQWVFYNKIPSRKHGGKRVFFKPEIDEWSASRRSGPIATSISRFESVRSQLRSLKTEYTAHPPKQKEVG